MWHMTKIGGGDILVFTILTLISSSYSMTQSMLTVPFDLMFLHFYTTITKITDLTIFTIPVVVREIKHN